MKALNVQMMDLYLIFRLSLQRCARANTPLRDVGWSYAIRRRQAQRRDESFLQEVRGRSLHCAIGLC